MEIEVEVQRGSPPRVVFWFRLYCGIVGLVYGAILASGVWGYFNPSWFDSLEGVAVKDIERAILVYVAIGGIFCPIYLAGLWVTNRSWYWLAGALLIAMSLGLCVTTPFGFALLFFWLQPEVRYWFGRD